MASKLNVGTLETAGNTDVKGLLYVGATGHLQLSADSSSVNVKHWSGGAYQERLTIDSAGLATFSAGIAFQSATTGSGTGTGYTLDAYEVGTWTPALSAPASGTLAYTSSGLYTRIGDQVHIQAIITITTATSLPTSALIINNAPFNSKYTVASKYYLNSFPLSRGTGVILADRTEDMHFGTYSDGNDLYLFTNVIGSAIQYDAVQAGDIQFAGTYTTKDA